MPDSPRALLFDFDGLLFDTETTEMMVWKDIYAGYGLVYPEERWSQNVGLWGTQHRFDSAAHLQDLLGRPLDVQALNRRHYDESAARFEQQPAREGVREYLDAAPRLGLRLAVASSSPRAWVETHLARLGLLDRFERLVTGDDVAPGRVKPAPDIYLRALEALRIGPGQAIAFEDSPHGLAAARQAGIFAVAVPNRTTAGLDLDADLRLASFTDLPLERLLERVSLAG